MPVEQEGLKSDCYRHLLARKMSHEEEGQSPLQGLFRGFDDWGLVHS